MILAPRSSGEYFSREEQRLLTDIARQVGVAAQTVQLTGHLQRSRQRIITTLEEERRRLRRDLHDGLGPQLASLTLKIDAARNLLKQTPDEVEPVLIQLKKETQSALKDIRRIAYDLRPPALDELGLIPALNEKVASLNQHSITRISFESPENIEPLPAAVEVAAYRIAMEALTNVIHHSKAKNCRLQINAKQRLEMEICDDDSVFAAMRAGARGYILKGADQEEMLRAIRAVANGEALFGPDIATRLMNYFSAPKPVVASQAFPELTDRERQVLELIAQGFNNRRIARHLTISEKTVRNHVSNIFNKLQVADRAQAIIRARKAGMGE